MDIHNFLEAQLNKGSEKRDERKITQANRNISCTSLQTQIFRDVTDRKKVPILRRYWHVLG